MFHPAKTKRPTYVPEIPPILAGNGSTGSYIMFAVIVALVIGVLYFVFSQLDKNVEEEV